MSILILCDHENGQLSPVTLNAVSAASQIGGDMHLLVAGDASGNVAKAAASIAGVAKVLVADDKAFENGLAENLAPLLQSLSAGYSHIMAAATTTGKNVMPRLAAMLDVMQISDIIKVVDANSFQRPIYAGNALSTVSSNEAIKVITVRGTAFEAVASEGGSAAIEAVTGGGEAGLSAYVKSELSSSERPELTSAPIVVSGGRGMQDGANFAMLEKVADKLGAAVGASRAAVDAGFVPNDYQVGQTGKVVAPDLYIAVGISGAIQHLAGMKDSKVIVAINKDDEAPIFQVADYGLVADLFDAVPALEQELG
ncbi:MAG: electron transfer flavoprotein subunit alpha/FixB family protein [Alphaproteobacteria bacterium]|jgi:electron transfer flavoprotein alpha subunit|nr:electron transfer flavoprotein subunit alpha/FixB family protein [Alphaproteobacteria bacterium]NDA18667.1 electron transfer flavoprotein subunit alpha/FixB family protein [Alphaproteobacteria bacterium]NDG36470.1 electron transfer flavoprotein subunit alpha/FixB family protein [Alphaproteobacteria bacterium]